MKKVFNVLIVAMLMLPVAQVNANSYEVIAATTSAGQSGDIVITGAAEIATVYICTANGSLTAGEYADIQISDDGGTTWFDMYKDGSQLRLHSTNNHESIYGRGTFRVDKEATTNAVAICVNQGTGLTGGI